MQTTNLFSHVLKALSFCYTSKCCETKNVTFCISANVQGKSPKLVFVGLSQSFFLFLLYKTMHSTDTSAVINYFFPTTLVLESPFFCIGCNSLSHLTKLAVIYSCNVDFSVFLNCQQPQSHHCRYLNVDTMKENKTHSSERRSHMHNKRGSTEKKKQGHAYTRNRVWYSIRQQNLLCLKEKGDERRQKFFSL